MKYAEYVPAPQLRSYIDAYWVMETDYLLKPFQKHIYADGCTEIFINIGNSTPVINGRTALMPGNIYLGGTMTSVNVVTSVPDSRFVGIRFKPAGFAAFYKLPVHEIVDEVIEFPDNKLRSIVEIDEGLNKRLDAFFINRITTAPLRVVEINSTIEQYKGVVSVDFLARQHNLTTRTLERYFLREVGIAPKLFINIVRFIHTTKRIQRNSQKESLLNIAYEMGYYDHAHLAKEIKRFSGLNPSEMAFSFS